MSLVWENLSFQADASLVSKLAAKLPFGSSPEKNIILNNVSGSINLGELVSLLGPSGSGKSTYVNCLIQGKNLKGFGGKILLTGFPEGEPVKASLINQNVRDHLLLSLTVTESLRYASFLKNPPGTLDRVHDQIIQELIDELQLKSCENNQIMKCSEGEMKRLAIGMELTAMEKPRFLFLDEPTSGLDSFVGFKVITLLRKLAKSHNMAIVTTIHQPSYKLFTQFSKAFILSGRGEFIFAGEPTRLRETLEQAGYHFDQGYFENPADVAIEVASSMKRYPGSPKQYQQVGFLYQESHYDSDSWTVNIIDDSDTARILNKEDEESATIYDRISQNLLCSIKKSSEALTQKMRKTDGNFTCQNSGLCSTEACFTFYNLFVLLKRCARTSILNQKQFIAIQLGLHVVVAAVLASMYNRQIGKASSCTKFIYPENDTFDCTCQITPATLKGQYADASNNNVKFQFFSLLFLMFASLMPTVLTFPSEIKLFLSEFRNGWYSTGTYYIAKTITEIPLQIIFPSIFVYFLYWYSHQIGMEYWYNGIFMSGRYLNFLSTTILCCLIAQGLGFLIGILCVRSFNISIIVSSSVLLFLFLFSGFFVKRSDMGESVAVITDFSFVRYGLEALLLIIYGNSRCVKPESSSVLEIFGLNDGDFSIKISMLIAHLLVIRFLAFLLFKYRADDNCFSRCFKCASLKNGFYLRRSCCKK